jgi:hypothetical protein
MKEENETETCDRCNNEAGDLHTCPFKEEINGNYESLCNCCSDCRHECCMDI